MATKPKKARIRNTADLDLLRMYGPTPTYKGKDYKTDPSYSSELGHALNWCSRGLEAVNAKQEILFWMKTHKYSDAQITAIKHINEHYLRTIGSVIYLTNNSFPIPDEMMETSKNKIAEFIIKGKELKRIKTKENKSKADADKLRLENTKSTACVNAIEANKITDIIEDMLFTSYNLNDDILMLETGNQKAIVLTRVKDDIDEFIAEMESTKTNKEMAEAYSHITKRNIVKIIKGFESALIIIDNAIMNKSVSRKTRKVAKPKSAAQQVHKMKYKTKDKDLGVASVDPMLIVGASKMIVYNVKTRKLGIYIAKDDAGFVVKGTSIQNFDDVQSNQKTVRAVKNVSISDTVTSFRKSPKVKCSKMFDDMKTMGTKLTGRINGDTLLLKIFR